ncbi:uncharacterized protein BYT42DRAFT_613637 [Radiomyces spectabilis]|uniref:uncharacterized protein n=1 Tax=Radiomyces spectabilis TaxID=64574 RepID=UPI00221F5B62|nr:uncharacterized protein BYT42DRAFT_613637 [Radiomyces spectabilis]KAI8379317.1 hypothetical protein BYT42DRAFT_613637 [Radiomyces spectabilis]
MSDSHSQQIAESTTRIKDLHEAEKKLVLLLETAGEALAVLSEDGPHDNSTDDTIEERVQVFRNLASRYFSIVNDVQLALRNHTHYLAKKYGQPLLTPFINGYKI